MIFYFLLVLIGSVIAGRLILGELRKERRNYIAVAPQQLELEKPVAENLPSARYQPTFLEDSDSHMQERIHKIEVLLAEKNAELIKLQTLLETEQKNKTYFEKIKNLLECQVFESRQMNKDIKRELAALSAQGKQFQDEAARLKTELNYKEQVLLQNESKILELKNRLHGFLSTDSTKAFDPRLKTEDSSEQTSFDEFDWQKKLRE